MQEPMKFKVSKIDNIIVRRLVILLTFPFLILWNTTIRHIINSFCNAPWEIIQTINYSRKVWHKDLDQ